MTLAARLRSAAVRPRAFVSLAPVAAHAGAQAEAPDPAARTKAAVLRVSARPTPAALKLDDLEYLRCRGSSSCSRRTLPRGPSGRGRDLPERTARLTNVASARRTPPQVAVALGQRVVVRAPAGISFRAEYPDESTNRKGFNPVDHPICASPTRCGCGRSARPFASSSTSSSRCPTSGSARSDSTWSCSRATAEGGEPLTVEALVVAEVDEELGGPRIRAGHGWFVVRSPSPAGDDCRHDRLVAAARHAGLVSRSPVDPDLDMTATTSISRKRRSSSVVAGPHEVVEAVGPAGRPALPVRAARLQQT